VLGGRGRAGLGPPGHSGVPGTTTGLTVVLNVLGLLVCLVCGDSVDLHAHQWVDDGSVLAVGHFGQLLPTDHLREGAGTP